MTPPICPYCGSTARLVRGTVVYPNRHDLAHLSFWACADYPRCDAYVGCHPNSAQPLGRLADAELRLAKRQAHAVFDPIWKAKRQTESLARGTARRAGYAWLAERLEIPVGECHIGHFDAATCRRVVAICAQNEKTPPGEAERGL